jgi:predicted transcriptional regulator of viral defense system
MKGKKSSTAPRSILWFMKWLPHQTLTAPEIEDSLSLDPDSPSMNVTQIQSILSRLAREGHIIRVDQGRYRYNSGAKERV